MVGVVGKYWRVHSRVDSFRRRRVTMVGFTRSQAGGEPECGIHQCLAGRREEGGHPDIGR